MASIAGAGLMIFEILERLRKVFNFEKSNLTPLLSGEKQTRETRMISQNGQMKITRRCKKYPDFLSGITSNTEKVIVESVL
jgi:hypothetical protein